jgi:transcriptional regulator with XRE-family HTH domain
MIEPKQIRAARALLDWTRDDLARASGVSVPALGQIEGENRAPRTASLDKIKAALEAAGILFTDNSGVKLRSDTVVIYEDTDGVRRFFDDVYMTVQHSVPEILIGGGLQKDFFDAMGKEFLEFHAARIRTIDGISVRALKPNSLGAEAGLDYVEFRYLPDHQFNFVPFYLYGTKLGIITWRPELRVLVINDQQISDAYRHQYELIWKTARRKPTLDEGVE